MSLCVQVIENLHKAIGDMTAADAKKWMKMCVAAGLWVAQDPHEFSDDEDEDEEDEDEEQEDEDEDEEQEDEKGKKEGTENFI